MGNAIVECIGVERTYSSAAGPVRVLRGVDLLVEPGKLIALYGPSGSGKTTLLNLIGALDRPSAGSLIICGKDLSRLWERGRSALRRKQIGFIFQNYALLPTYTAFENVDLALRLPRLGWRERNKRALAALEAVGLGAWANHVPDEMSGGQRKRVAIARALALRPKLMLADEPTGGLDTRTTERIMALFRSFAEQQGTTFVIVSHDPLVANYVDLTYDMHEGKVVLRSAAPALPSESAPNPEPARIPQGDPS
jgi:ABC-type lipoprotein export system ATPase subunit